MTLTETKLQVLCWEWQRILRLQDWDIAAKVCSLHEMTDKQAYGEVEPFPAKMHAYIRILDPEQVEEDSRPWVDVERTLVHELLHLRLPLTQRPNSDRDPDWLPTEQGLHTTADALVRLRRNGLPAAG